MNMKILSVTLGLSLLVASTWGMDDEKTVAGVVLSPLRTSSDVVQNLKLLVEASPAEGTKMWTAFRDSLSRTYDQARTELQSCVGCIYRLSGKDEAYITEQIKKTMMNIETFNLDSKASAKWIETLLGTVDDQYLRDMIDEHFGSSTRIGGLKKKKVDEIWEAYKIARNDWHVLVLSKDNTRLRNAREYTYSDGLHLLLSIWIYDVELHTMELEDHDAGINEALKVLKRNEILVRCNPTMAARFSKECLRLCRAPAVHSARSVQQVWKSFSGVIQNLNHLEPLLLQRMIEEKIKTGNYNALGAVYSHALRTDKLGGMICMQQMSIQERINDYIPTLTESKDNLATMDKLLESMEIKQSMAES